MQIPPAQQVHVQMKHGLSGAGSHVEHSPIAVFNAALARDFRRYQMAPPDDPGMLSRRFLQAANMLLGDHQHMGRGLRVDVLERKCVLVFERLSWLEFLRE